MRMMRDIISPKESLLHQWLQTTHTHETLLSKARLNGEVLTILSLVGTKLIANGGAPYSKALRRIL